MHAIGHPPRLCASVLQGALVLLLVGGASAQPAAAQDHCVRLICGKGSEDDHCTIRPAQLVARMPAAFAIVAIRGNTLIATQGDASTANCAPAKRLAQEVSLDRASLYGSVEITGQLQATGILRFEPNDGGELEFRPGRETFKGTGPFFRANFQRIKLDSAQPAVNVVPPRPLAGADCWQAQATAQLSDFSVLVGDTSAAGTYPRRARITAVHGFTRCTWGGP